MWDEGFCEALAERGHYVVRFDNRDVGLSTKFDAAGIPNVMELMLQSAAGKTLTVPYTLDDMADDAAGLLDALGLDSVHVCGASMGGMIAQTVAIRHGRRLRSLTSIMSTTGNPSVPPAKPEAMAVLMAPPPTRSRRQPRRRRAHLAHDRQPRLPVRRGEDPRARRPALRPRLPSRRARRARWPRSSRTAAASRSCAA